MKKSNQTPHLYRLIFTQNMRQLRRIKEFSQEELAFQAGISKTYVCEIENGGRAVSIDLMGQIADALETPLDKLLIEQDLTKMF